MKTFKVLFISVLITIVINIPIISSAAAQTNDNKIIDDVQTFGIENVPTLLASQTEYDFPLFWRNQSIYITRTNINTGITITAINNGSHAVDVCIFQQGSSTEVVGLTKTIQPGLNILSWTKSSLKNVTKVYIYFTMYGTYYNPMNIVITY